MVSACGSADSRVEVAYWKGLAVDSSSYHGAQEAEREGRRWEERMDTLW